MKSEINFGELIKQARKKQGYSQRELAEKLGIDFTYLSKLENDRVEYAPKEELIIAMAKYLNLEQNELVFLAGRIPQKDEELIKQHYQKMPMLFRKMRENPQFAEKIFLEAQQNN